MKTGRNDPCPCGSGRKFKNCCLGKASVAGPDSSQEAPPVRTIESQLHCGLVEKLMDFLQRPNNKQDLTKALLTFLPDGPYDEVETNYAQQVFHAWYMHFVPDENDETLGERFLRKHGHLLSPEERRILDAMTRERFRLMEVREVRPMVGLTLEDLHTGEVFEVLERSASQSLVPWDTILTRLRRFRTHSELDLAVPLARKAKESFMTLLAEMLELARRENPEVLIQDLMTFGMAQVFSNVVTLNRAAARPPRMLNSEGDELVLCSTRYSVKDIEAVRDALRKHRSYSQDDSDGSFIWLSGRRRMLDGRVDRTCLGTVRFDGRDLVLETNSERRLKKGKASLEKVADKWLKHRADSFQDLGQALTSTPAGRGHEREPEIPVEVEMQVLTQFYERYYLEQWPNAPVPALGGQTPMEAARDPRRKEQVVELLKGIENGLARDPKACFDVSRLWKKLRLER